MAGTIPITMKAPIAGFFTNSGLSSPFLCIDGGQLFQSKGVIMSVSPLLADAWSTRFGVPPFDQINEADYVPAFEAAMATHNAEIAAIAGNSALPTFDNVIEALERAGSQLERVASVFFNLAGSNSNDALQAIQREISPKMAGHYTAIYANQALYARVKAVELPALDPGDPLSVEQHRVLERYLKAFERAGAHLDDQSRQRLAEIAQKLASLGTQFGQNILGDEKEYALFLDGSDDFAGLPDFLLDAAAEAAGARGKEGSHAITLSRSLIEPFLIYSTRRDLRETAYKAWIARGENPARDNRPIIAETCRLRDEKAKLLGFENFAAFKLDDSMAGNAAAVDKLLNDVWQPASRQARRERARLQALAQDLGDNIEIAAWDWRHYAEKLRVKEFALDDTEIKPYLSLDNMIAAAFDVAGRLFGLKFKEIRGLALYHDDVRAFEVTGQDGGHVGLFLGDYFARDGKRSGAWMSGFRRQEKLRDDVRPIIVNVMNFAKGNPTLLSFDDARTLFHEFGHALHGLLSDVTYPSIAGTAVSRDFVELPSQLFEHWLLAPEILAKHALHITTGEPISADLIAKIKAASTFNQGFAAVEFIGSAMADLDLHTQPVSDEFDAASAENQTRAKLDMPSEVSLRHRLPHFAHVFSGDGYASGYYSYLWSEVMDADAFSAFEETGDLFDQETAQKLHDFIYSAGNRQDAGDAYRAFRGSMPSVEPLLEKRGFLPKAA